MTTTTASHNDGRYTIAMIVPNYCYCITLLLLALLLLLCQANAQGDPTCSTGIPGQGRHRGVCCSSSCGSVCGGMGCSDLPGGAESCCTGAIIDAAKSCLYYPPPCRLDHVDACNGGSSVDDPLDVLVIGAGWAGLAAGSQLLSATTTNFCILEGREVMGGRSRTLMSYFQEGLPTELGSGWVYTGSNVERVFQAAGLITDVPTHFKWDDMALYVEHNTTTTTPTMDVNSQQNYDGIIRNAYDQFVKYAKSTARHDINMQTIKDSYLQQNPQLSILERRSIDTLVTTILHSEWGAYLNNADSSAMLQYLDYDYIIHYVGIPGSGFKPALEYLAAPFVNHIRYNHQVVSIDYEYYHGYSTTTATSKQSPQQQLVKVTSIDRTTNATNVHYARAAICTVSLGVLKHGDITFVPSLPDTKTQAIQNMAMGSKNKCLLYWDVNHIANLNIASWWPYGITDLQLFVHNDQNNTDWTIFLNDQNHRGNENIHVLSAWIGAERSDLWESRSNEETLQHVMRNLRKMFPQIPEPTKYYVTRWKSDPFTRGTYTYYSAGVDYGQAALALAAPVGNNRLYFAGEATWPSGMGAPSAFSSGVTAVRGIAQSGVLLLSSTTPAPITLVPQTAPPITTTITPQPITLVPQTAPPITTTPATPQPITLVPQTAPPISTTPSPITLVPQTAQPITSPPTLSPTEEEEEEEWNFIDWFLGIISSAEETPAPSGILDDDSPTTTPVTSSGGATLCGRTGFPCDNDAECCEGYMCSSLYSQYEEIGDDVIKKCTEY